MTTNVALLRGINVGRNKRVSMADLRAVYADLGLIDVKTHLQSGNVVFTADGELGPDAAERLEEALLARTGVQSKVLLLSADELLAVAADNPLTDVATDPTRLIVTFLEELPDAGRLELPDPAALEPEVLHVGPRAIYQWIPGGLLASKVPPSFWKGLPPLQTNRNWRTVTKLVELVADRHRPG
jgi:uncharacterized protein (DUF1697 family)